MQEIFDGIDQDLVPQPDEEKNGVNFSPPSMQEIFDGFGSTTRFEQKLF